MSVQLTEAQEQLVNTIYNEFNGKFAKCFIKFILVISAPGRAALRVSLTQAKAAYQSQLNELILRKVRSERLSKSVQAKVDLAQKTLDNVKSPLNITALASAILDGPCPDVDKVTTLLGVNFPKVPGLNFGGYDGAVATLSALNYELNRVRNAVDIGQTGVDIINDKIRMIDSIISVLDAF